MLSYPDEYTVIFTVPFTDRNDASITPTSVSATLYDGEEALLMDFGSLVFDAASGQVEITVLGELNTLAGNESRAARELRVVMQTATESVTKLITYMIEAEQSLSVMINSFQTFGAAEVAVQDMVNLSGWDVADDTRRRAALVESYKRITSIPLKYSVRDDNGNIMHREEVGIDPDQWGEILAEDFRSFPTHFRRALQRAQILEANELLQGDKLGAKRRAGIISETIGHSSVVLAQNSFEMSLSVAAMQALTGHVNYDLRVRRG